MNITQLKIPITIVATIIVFTIGSVVTVEFRYVKAEDFTQFIYRQAIKDDRQSLETLESKLDDADSPEDRERIERQIERTERSLFINMEKLEE